MDFMQYHAGYFSGENFHQFVRQAHHTCNPVIQEDNPYPDLNANKPPWSSSSKDSNPYLRHIIDTGLDVNLFSEDSKSRQSARTSPDTLQTPRPGKYRQELKDIPSLPKDFSTPPQTVLKQRGRPKGSTNLKRTVINFDEETLMTMEIILCLFYSKGKHDLIPEHKQCEKQPSKL